jgi:hypothetical protein
VSAFHQIGHDSENLMFDDGLMEFGGAILSPLNYSPSEVGAQLEKLKERAGFTTIFDPHLYRPQSERGCLPEWDYYPKDVDTADFTPRWQAGIVDRLAQTVVALGPTSVASPAIVPRTFTDEFYLQLVYCANRLQENLKGCAVNPVQTILASLPELATPTRAMAIASIVSKSKVEDCLLMLVGNTEPRRELSDPEELKGAMKLIAALEENGQRVTVGACSSDMVLWKAAGATNCASGKFFNLRRFTISRFEEPNGGGGGQLGYWFEESLLCFLRQSDLLRVEAKGLLSEASQNNPYSAKILENIPQSKAWLGLGWRHFLYWFADVERRLSSKQDSAADLIANADENWGTLETSVPKIYMEERQNSGDWVRQWRRALAELPFFA